MATKKTTTPRGMASTRSRPRTDREWRVGEAATMITDDGRRVRVVRGPDLDEGMTDAEADALATQAMATHRRRQGRPSLSGAAADSPQVAFRLTPRLRAQAERVAAKTGQTLSQMARAALAAWLAQTERRA